MKEIENYFSSEVLENEKRCSYCSYVHMLLLMTSATIPGPGACVFVCTVFIFPSWALLRAATWTVLLIRVTLQVSATSARIILNGKQELTKGTCM